MSHCAYRGRLRIRAVFAAARLPAIILMVSLSSAAIAQNSGNGEAKIELARRGLQQMMDGDIDGAIEIFRNIQKQDPEAALGYLLESDANWWKIYLTRGNLIDPDVFESISEATTPYDADFERLNGLTIQKAEAALHARQQLAQNYLYESLAYAMAGRIAALRDHALAVARSGKKMRSLGLSAQKADPRLYDANLPIGLYNYFVDTLPGYVRMLRFLIMLPGGNREVGLKQLQEAAEKGDLTRGEAEFHLAKNYSRANEHQYAKALELFEVMRKSYPHHPLWTLLAGSLAIRMGQTDRGEALYRDAINATANLKGEIWQPLRQQAAQALEKRHPGEKAQ